MRNNKKIIVIDADVERDYDCGDGDINFKIHEVNTPDDFVGIISGAIYWAEIVPSLLSGDAGFIAALSSCGFTRVENVKAFGDKATLTGDFFVYNPKEPYGFNKLKKFRTEEAYDARDLAKNGAELLVGVDRSCLKFLNPKAYKVFLDEKKNVAKRAKVEILKSKKREEKKKQKAIEKAKKILEQAGVE